MTDQRTLEAILKFGVDERSLRSSTDKLRLLSREFERLKQEAGNTQKAIAIALEHGEETGLLRAHLSDVQTAMRRVAQTARDYVGREAAEAAKRAERRFDELRSTLSQVRETGEQLSTLGNYLALPGAALLGGVGASAKQYLDYVGMTTQASADWLRATHEIENAYLRVGRTATEELLPAIEKAASLAQVVADFVEQNPEVIKAVIGMGGLMVGAGGALKLGGTAMKLFGSGGLIATTLAKWSGAGAAGGGAATIGGAGGLASLAPLLPLLGIPLGLGGYEAYARATGGTRLNQFATVGAYGLGKLFGSIAGLDDAEIERKALVFAEVVGRTTGAIEKAGEQAQNNAPDVRPDTVIPAGAVEAYGQYRQQLADAEARYEEQRTRTVEQFASQRADLEARYEEQRTRLTADYEQRRAREEEDYSRRLERQWRDYRQAQEREEQTYYEQRTRAARRYGRDIARLEADHRRQMRQLAEDHNTRMLELAANRDALGMAREMRRYERERRRAEEGHIDQAQRMRQDYADQLREMEAAFARQREAQRKAFEQRLADQQQEFETRRKREQEDFRQRMAVLDDQHRQEMAKLEANEQETLRKLDDAYRRQVDTLENAFIQRLRALDPVILGDYAAYQSELQRMALEFRAWLQRYRSGSSSISTQTSARGGSTWDGWMSSLGSRQSGGYVTAGLWRLHDREFVLNPQTTAALERLAGGRLTQGRLLDVAGGGRRQVQANVQIRVDGLSEAAMLRKIGRVAEQTFLDVLEQV